MHCNASKLVHKIVIFYLIYFNFICGDLSVDFKILFLQVKYIKVKMYKISEIIENYKYV